VASREAFLCHGNFVLDGNCHRRGRFPPVVGTRRCRHQGSLGGYCSLWPVSISVEHVGKSSLGLQIHILSFRSDCCQWKSSCREREKLPV
jgi:hypothetical protein